GLQRLYALQNLDGGWGWWPNESSSPSLTAYVLLGLVEARRADFAVDARTIDLAVAFLKQWLEFSTDDAPASRDERAFVLYALAEAGQGDMGRTVLLYDKRADMSLYAKAYLAMTLNILDPQGTTRLTTLSNELVNAAQLSATGAHWQEKLHAKWAMNTDTRTTAIILRALVQIAPKNPLLPQVVRWLMTARSTGRWETTQENVWAIWALTDYMLATGEFQADYAYELLVNDVNWAKGRVTKETLDDPILVRVPVGRLLSG
ncbi:MAG: alpha-2-macroglobulin, partial [Chloroflexi bacterium]|nr:alpha-2-macroglobulin [Chloroflexota bacterium]